MWTALKNPQPDVRPDADWAYRLQNAHRNAIENLVVFAPLAIIITLLNAATEMTEVICWVFLFSRIAHAVIYALGVPLLRTVAFAVGFGCQVVLAFTIMNVA